MSALRIASVIPGLILALAGCQPPPTHHADAPDLEAARPEDGEAVRVAARLEPGALGGTILAGQIAEPPTLLWPAAGDTVSHRLSHLISDSLVFNDDAMNIVGKLARSWSWSEDRLTLTFELRDDARWEDGVPVTSADVLFTYDRIVDPETGAENLRAQFDQVAALEAPDPLTVVVRYERPYAPGLASWNVPLLPAHRFGDDQPFLDHPLGRHPLSCGPWLFSSWTAGKEIVLEPNPDYYLGRPGPDRLVVRFMNELTTQFQALELGELDFGTLTPLLRRKARATPGFEERFELVPYYVSFVFYVGWNGSGAVPFLDDPRVRRAMTMAMDRQGYVDGPWFGQARVATGSFHPSMWAYDVDLDPWPFDPAGAKRALAEAGFADGDGDGVIEKDGRPLAFSLLYFGSNEDNRRLAAWARDSLAEVGIRVNLEPLAFPLLLERLGERRYEAFMLGQSFDVDPDPYDLWHSSQIEEGMNRTAYRSEEMDRLLEEGRAAVEVERRAAIYREVQALLHRDQPATFLFYPASAVAVSRQLRGIGLSPRGAWLHWPGPSGWWRADAPSP